MSLVISLPWVVWLYLVMSVVTFGVYWVDKTRAARGRWRISEGMLHGLELLGGWPGGLAGQRVLRHKNRKTRYQVVFWGIVVVHLLFWVWWSGILRIG